MGIVGCVSQPEMDLDIVETEAVYFETIGQGETSLFTDTTRIAIRDQGNWDTSRENMKTVLPFPEIDFSQLMAVVVAVPMPVRGVTVQVQSVEVVEDEMVVSYLMGVPGDDCRGNDQPSVPFQVIMLPQQPQRPIRFEEAIEEYRCTL